MAKTKIILKNSGFRELRTSSAAVGLVRKEAEAIASRAGSGFEMIPMESPSNRAHAIVRPVTAEAVRLNARDNTLLRAVSGGAGSGFSLYTAKSGKTSLRTDAEIANYTRAKR